MEGDVRQSAGTQHCRLQEAAQRRRADYLTGIALLMSVVILWTGSNFLTSSLMTGGYDKPFAMTYANTSSFALYMIPFGCALRRGQRHGRYVAHDHLSFWEKLGFRLPRDRVIVSAHNEDLARPQSPEYGAGSPAAELRSALPSSVLQARPSSIDGRRPRSTVGGDSTAETARQRVVRSAALTTQEARTSILPPLSVRQTAELAASFTVVWFAANWSLNAGLGLTSVASGTTLSSASGFFTLGLGTTFGVERFTRSKLVAVTMSFVGVAMVTTADSSVRVSDGPASAPLGDALALLSAFFYALYVTLLKVRIGSEDRISMPLFFGFVGLFNIFFLWPIGIVLHLTGIEPFAWPSHAILSGVLINMAITFVSDFAYLLAMLKSSPLVATVGLSLTIPLAVFGDILKGSHSGGVQADLGSTIVLLSFVAIGLADNAALTSS